MGENDRYKFLLDVVFVVELEKSLSLFESSVRVPCNLFGAAGRKAQLFSLFSILFYFILFYFIFFSFLFGALFFFFYGRGWCKGINY